VTRRLKELSGARREKATPTSIKNEYVWHRSKAEKKDFIKMTDQQRREKKRAIAKPQVQGNMKGKSRRVPPSGVGEKLSRTEARKSKPI